MVLKCRYCDSYARDHFSFQVSSCPNHLSLYDNVSRSEYSDDISYIFYIPLIPFILMYYAMLGIVALYHMFSDINKPENKKYLYYFIFFGPFIGHIIKYVIPNKYFNPPYSLILIPVGIISYKLMVKN